MTAYSSLLELPPFPAERYAVLADRLGAILATQNDVVFVQAEAILALEAAATSLGTSGRVAVNIVTSPYGGYFGDWLQRAGANVHTVAAEAGRPIDLEAVKTALDRVGHVDLVALVHAETSSGILNPLHEIAALVRAHGALLVVDAVASVGGHPLEVDALGIDVCVIGPQKALGGPAGLSALSVSPRAWAAMQFQKTPSSLSVLDLKGNWLDRGRGALPGMPSGLEFWALDAALDRVEDEGLENRIARHKSATIATRAGLAALGTHPWVEDLARASTLVTAVPIPAGIDAAEFLGTARHFGASASPGFGAVQTQLIRLDHTGPRATSDQVIANLVGYGIALQAAGASVDLLSSVKQAHAAILDVK